MKISENILVGIDYPIYCEFYGSITHYVHFINSQFDNQFDNSHELIGLIVKNDDAYVYEEYYILKENTIYKYSNTSTIATKEMEWNNNIIVTKKEYKNAYNGLSHIRDLDYYLKIN